MSRYQYREPLDQDDPILAPAVAYDAQIGSVVLIGGYENDEELFLSAQEALHLLAWLREYEELLQDQARNYYDCRECGDRHQKSVRICPTLLAKDDG